VIKIKLKNNNKNEIVLIF